MLHSLPFAVSRSIPVHSYTTHLDRLFEFARFAVYAATGESFPISTALGGMAQVRYIGKHLPIFRRTVLPPQMTSALSKEELLAADKDIGFVFAAGGTEEPAFQPLGLAVPAAPLAVPDTVPGTGMALTAIHTIVPPVLVDLGMPPTALTEISASLAVKNSYLAMQVSVLQEALVETLKSANAVTKGVFSAHMRRLTTGQHACLPPTVAAVYNGLLQGAGLSPPDVAPTPAATPITPTTRYAVPTGLTPSEAYALVSSSYIFT